MNKISRKGFLKIAAAAAMSGVTAGALAACNAASSSTAASAGAAGSYTPGTYTGTAEGISSTVKVTMTFSDSAVTDVVVDTSGETASYGAAAAEELKNQLLNAGSDEIDGVSGSTITSDAVKKAAKSCFAQAKGEATVTSVQLPTGDETDWLGKEPDIDEAAITETVDTDILIVGAGNGGMFAAAYAAAKGLNFRVIEQNGNVQDTRHWVGAVDGFGAQEQGIKMDRAKLLSEVSRYASGKCDQRVVKTWINESAEMIEFVRSIMEDKYGVKMIYTYGDEAKWPAENAEHNTDYMYPEIEYTYDRSSGAARNELLLQYIQELGYDVDFKTSLAKLEKNSDGRITGIIAQSTEDDHFIRYNANKGVLLACGGFPGNPYMMEQLDPLGTSVTTACSYSPSDKGYGIRAAMWAGANLDKEAAPMLFDRGIVAPGVDGGYVDSDTAFGGKAFPGTIRQYNPGTQPFLKVTATASALPTRAAPTMTSSTLLLTSRAVSTHRSAMPTFWRTQSVSTPSAALPRPATAVRSTFRVRWTRRSRPVHCSSAIRWTSWLTRWALLALPRTPSLPLWSATTSSTTSRTMRTSASRLTASAPSVPRPSTAAGWVPLC